MRSFVASSPASREDDRPCRLPTDNPETKENRAKPRNKSERTNDMQNDRTTPAAMAIPKGGYFVDKVEQGRYGPIFPKTPACYGFSILAKLKPGGEDHLYNHAKVMEKAVADNPTFLAPLAAHYLRWVIFTIKGESYMMYQGVFDTDFDKYCEDASMLFGQSGIKSAFEVL